MKVVITDAAEADLIQIGDYIRRDNATRAASFLAALLTRCQGLAELPRAYPLVPRYEAWGIRRRVHGNYSIFYRVGEEQIDVVHILYGARDFEALLFPET